MRSTYKIILGYEYLGSDFEDAFTIEAASRVLAIANAVVKLARTYSGGDLTVIYVGVADPEKGEARQDGYAGGRQSGKAGRDMYMAGGDMIVDKKRR